jgi:hypothetical protein
LNSPEGYAARLQSHRPRIGFGGDSGKAGRSDLVSNGHFALIRGISAVRRIAARQSLDEVILSGLIGQIVVPGKGINSWQSFPINLLLCHRGKGRETLACGEERSGPYSPR